MNENEDHEPRSIDECKSRDVWPKWKEAIEGELISLSKRKVFGPIFLTPEKGGVVRYKACLDAQGFSQRAGNDYEETCSPMVDATTF
ncbi:unnamed protein product [Linum trigynum]|uniref:Reverse transcriptase n=1 Tax=Linum trigynum TaxID=586398 RepID=A0AAV2F766_9ROSI